MNYTISEVAKKFNLTPHTIRYYDKENILSSHRNKNGVRYFTDEDLEQLEMVCCLKSTGMSIKDINKYFELCSIGDETLIERLNIFTNHRDYILKEMETLNKNLSKIDYKIKWYKELSTPECCNKKNK